MSKLAASTSVRVKLLVGNRLEGHILIPQPIVSGNPPVLQQRRVKILVLTSILIEAFRQNLPQHSCESALIFNIDNLDESIQNSQVDGAIFENEIIGCLTKLLCENEEDEG